MKVKYLYNDGQLDYNGIYNVFAVQEWNKGEEKFYISDHDTSGNFHITPFDSGAFEIVNRVISKFWVYGVDNFGKKTVGIPEIMDIKYFWEKYYDDDIEIKRILDLYYKIGKNELFNTGATEKEL